METVESQGLPCLPPGLFSDQLGGHRAAGGDAARRCWRTPKSPRLARRSWSWGDPAMRVDGVVVVPLMNTMYRVDERLQRRAGGLLGGLQENQSGAAGVKHIWTPSGSGPCAKMESVNSCA